MRKYIRILILLLLCGCEIFSLREAEPPEKPAEWNYTYTTWQKALQNLEFAYEDERNLIKYDDLLLPNFRFYFAQQDINDLNITAEWNKEKERDMLYNLQNWADSIRIELEVVPDQQDEVFITPIKLYRKYTLIAKHDTEVRIYAGKLELQMMQDNGFWKILKWYDFRTVSLPSQPSWGKLKYDFSV